MSQFNRVPSSPDGCKVSRSQSLTKRAASYVRVSSTRQEEDGTSLETQQAAIIRYIAERGYSLATEHAYRDVYSGAEYRGRPGLSRLREAIRLGEIDILVFYAIDRLSRNQTHLAVLADEAESHAVRFECITEEWDDSAVGKAVRNLRAFVAETEREKIIERTIRGRMARAKDRHLLLPGPKPLYGYRWPEERDHKGRLMRGRLVEDPCTAPVVRRMFIAIVAGTTLRQLAASLSEEGIPTPTNHNTRWSASTIARMLHVPAYKGEAYSWGLRAARASSSDFDSDKLIKLPDGTIPALIDSKTWDAAQVILARNKARAIRSAKDPEAALLRGGYVRCGYCNGHMRAQPRSNGRKDHQYVCRQRLTFPGSCPGATISCPKLDSAVWAKACEILTDPHVVRQEIERLRTQDPTTDDRATTERLLAQVERQQKMSAHAVAMLDDPEAAEPLVAQLEQLAERKRGLLAERERIEQSRYVWGQAQANLDNLEQWCATAAANLEQLTYQQKRLALDVLGFTATVYRADHSPRYVISAEIDQQLVSPTT